MWTVMGFIMTRQTAMVRWRMLAQRALALFLAAAFTASCSEPARKRSHGSNDDADEPRSKSSGSSAVRDPSGSSSASTIGTTRPERDEFGACSGHEPSKWGPFAAYPSAKLHCCATIGGVPHLFVSIFVTPDASVDVVSFYEKNTPPKSTRTPSPEGVTLTDAGEAHSRLVVEPVTNMPAGCAPPSGSMTMLRISERPPYPH